MSQIVIKKTTQLARSYWRPAIGWGIVGGSAALYFVEPPSIFRYMYGSSRYEKK